MYKKTVNAVKPHKVNLKVCTSVRALLHDSKSTVVVYRGTFAENCPSLQNPKAVTLCAKTIVAVKNEASFRIRRRNLTRAYGIF